MDGASASAKEGVADLILYDLTDICQVQQESTKSKHDASLIASSTEGLIAFKHAGGRSVHIFRPSEAGDSQGEVKTCNPEYDATLQLAQHEVVTQMVWNTDSQLLYCLTNQAQLFTLNRNAILQDAWDRKLWGGGQPLDMQRGTSEEAFILTSKGLIIKVPSQKKDTMTLLDLKGHHLRATAIEFDEVQQQLITVGSAEKGSLGLSPCCVGWSIEASPKPLWHIGTPRPVSRLLWLSSAAENWQTAISPDCKRLAALNQSSEVFIVDLQAAHRGDVMPPAKLLQKADAVQWWDDNTILLMLNGNIHACKPEIAQDLFTPALPSFTPEAVVTSQYGGKEGHCCAYILRPSNQDESPEDGSLAQPTDFRPSETGNPSRQEKSRMWTVTKILQSSAQEKLDKLLVTQQWEAALILAESNHLDTDQIAKAQWGWQDVNQQSISRFWKSIRDRKWAVEDCLDRAASSLNGQQQLLHAALHETEQRIQDGMQGEETLMLWRLLRIKILSHTERLSLLTTALGRGYSPLAWREMRDLSVAQTACQLAGAGRIDELESLLTRCPFSLTPRILDALTEIPESLQPGKWASIVKLVLEMQEPEIPSNMDLLETKQMVDNLKEAGEFGLLLATENLAALSMRWHPPSRLSVAKWFRQRAFKVDAVTGSANLVQATIYAGLSLLGDSDPVLEQTKMDFEELQAAAVQGGNLVWSLQFEEYASHNLVGRLQLLTQSSNLATLSDDQACLSAVLKTRSTQDLQQSLPTFIAAQTASKLEWCCEILTRDIGQNLQIFRDWQVLVQSSVACMYSCNSLSEWTLLQRLENSVRDGISQANVELDEALQSSLQQAVLHAQGGEELCKLDCPQTMQAIRDCTADQAQTLLESLLAKNSEGRPSESRWNQLWRQLKVVQETAWPFISKQEVLLALCRRLLACKQWRIARNYLTGTGSTPLPLELAEKLLIDVARSHLSSATSVTGPELDLAQSCLNVLPESQAVQNELRNLQAVLRLRDLGVRILPSQFTQAGDRLGLVQAVLDSRPGSYQDQATLTSLAVLLGLTQRQSELQMKTAYAALREGDEAFARFQCMELVRCGVKEAWPLASQLSSLKSSMTQHPEETKTLLGFAMAHCPADQLSSHMELWRRADQGRSRPEMTTEEIIMEGFGSSTHRSLSRCKDADVAISILVAAGPKSVELLETCIQQHEAQNLDPAPIQLLGMTVASYQVLAGHSLTQPVSPLERSNKAEESLRWPPWKLHDEAVNVPGDILTPELESQKQALKQWAQKLRAAKEATLQNEIEVASSQKGNSASIVSEIEPANGQHTAEHDLLQVAKDAGTADDLGVEKMVHAVAVADRTGQDMWPLSLAYIESLLLHSKQPPQAKFEAACRFLLPEELGPPQGFSTALEAGVMRQLCDDPLSFAVALRLLARLDASQQQRQKSLKEVADVLEQLQDCLTDQNAVQLLKPLVEALMTQKEPLPIAPLSESEVCDQLARALDAGNVEKLCQMSLHISSVANANSIDSEWPEPGLLRLLTFCKEMRRAGKTQLPSSYSSVGQLLVNMEASQIIAAVRFVSLGGLSPSPVIKPMPKFVDKAVRLQALQDGCGLLSSRRVPDARELQTLEHHAEVLEAVVSASDEAGLSLAEQDKLEHQILASNESIKGLDLVRLLSRLLAAEFSFAKVDLIGAAITSIQQELLESQNEELSSTMGRSESPESGVKNVSPALQALNGLIEDIVRRGRSSHSFQAVDILITSLEQGSGPLLTEARQSVWLSLKRHLSDAETERDALVEVLTSLVNSDRWPGWKPAEPESVTTLTIWLQTVGALNPDFKTHIVPEHFGSLTDATELFKKLLKEANTPDQFKKLAELLTTTWQNGVVFSKDADNDQASRAVHLSEPSPSLDNTVTVGDVDGWDNEEFELEADTNLPLDNQPLSELPPSRPESTSIDNSVPRHSAALRTGALEQPVCVNSTEEAAAGSEEHEGWDFDEDITLDLSVPSPDSKQVPLEGPANTGLGGQVQIAALDEQISSQYDTAAPQVHDPQSNSESISAQSTALVPEPGDKPEGTSDGIDATDVSKRESRMQLDALEIAKEAAPELQHTQSHVGLKECWDALSLAQEAAGLQMGAVAGPGSL